MTAPMTLASATGTADTDKAREHSFGWRAVVRVRWARLTAAGVVCHVEAELGGRPVECARLNLHAPAARRAFVLAVRRRLAHVAEQTGVAVDLDAHCAVLADVLVQLAVDLYGELSQP